MANGTPLFGPLTVSISGTNCHDNNDTWDEIKKSYSLHFKPFTKITIYEKLHRWTDVIFLSSFKNDFKIFMSGNIFFQHFFHWHIKYILMFSTDGLVLICVKWRRPSEFHCTTNIMSEKRIERLEDKHTNNRMCSPTHLMILNKMY